MLRTEDKIVEARDSLRKSICGNGSHKPLGLLFFCSVLGLPLRLTVQKGHTVYPAQLLYDDSRQEVRKDTLQSMCRPDTLMRPGPAES